MESRKNSEANESDQSPQDSQPLTSQYVENEIQPIIVDLPSDSPDKPKDSFPYQGLAQLASHTATGQASDTNANKIVLSDVLDAVVNHYPEIEIFLGRMNTAEGELRSRMGEFDTVLASHAINQPLGFYQTYRYGAGVSQPLFGGGEVYGTYRIGDGNFEPWYGERETNEAGEFKAGFSLPLLKGQQIDARRAGLFAAEFEVNQVESENESMLLMIRRMAIQSYWDCVAASQAVGIQLKLLNLAKDRVDQIKKRVELEDLPASANIDNASFIAKRENDLVKARRVFQKTAIKLSLFLRDRNGQPIIAEASNFPSGFPDATTIDDSQLAADIAMALNRRPELSALESKRQALLVNLDYAENTLLPKLDVKGFAGQDIGGETSSKGDKTPFELQVGVLAEVPLQRRGALGKIQSTQGKLAQVNGKMRFVSDKIKIEVQDAASAINAAYDQILISERNVDLAEQSLALGKIAFEKEDIDLIKLNIYESLLTSAQLQVLDANLKYLYYRAIYENAIRSIAFESE